MLLLSLSCIMLGQEHTFRIPRPPAALLMAKTPTSGAGAVSCKHSRGNAAKIYTLAADHKGTLPACGKYTESGEERRR